MTTHSTTNRDWTPARDLSLGPGWTTPERPQKVAVAWCRNCEHYCPEDEVGTRCPGECGRKMVRRLGYIHECDERTISFTRADYAAHVRSHEDD